MTPIVTAAAMLGLVGIGLVLVAVRTRQPDAVAALLEEFEGTGVSPERGDYADRLEQPLLSRVLGPVVAGLIGLVGRFAPSTAAATARRRLANAGLTGAMSVDEYLAFRLVSGLLGIGLGLFFAAAIGGVKGLAFLVLLGGIGLAVPRGYVDRARDERVEAVQRELPDRLDLLAITVEAGLGFEQALATVVDRSDGVLAEELAHTLREMQLGRSRTEALRELQRRVDVPDLNSLVLSLIQADALGMPLTRILRTQAEELRRRRRQRTREKAAKLPVKMIVPTVLFIMPALFVVTLAPALITLSRTL